MQLWGLRAVLEMGDLQCVTVDGAAAGLLPCSSPCWNCVCIIPVTVLQLLLYIRVGSRLLVNSVLLIVLQLKGLHAFDMDNSAVCLFLEVGSCLLGLGQSKHQCM